MKIWVEDRDGKRWPAERPYEEAGHVLTEMVCQECGEAAKVSGRDCHIKNHDTYVAQGYCACGAGVGMLHCQLSTIFGLEEDEAVTKYGRARVY